MDEALCSVPHFESNWISSDGAIPEVVRHVGNQSWTPDNMWVESEHNGIIYYTPRWDALCPYIDVSEEMLQCAPKPFVVYALPPDSQYGVPISDKYGLVDCLSSDFWTDARRNRKFRDLDKQFKTFRVSEDVMPGSRLTVDDVLEIGGEHFERYGIHLREVEGLIDYVRRLDVLLLRVYDGDGTLVLSDLSILMPKYDQLYGSFCQWNRAYRSISPGIYACLLACRWAAKNNIRFYNLGPVDDYGYKMLFVTDFEPIYSIALIDPDHPLATDLSSPLYLDFERGLLNQIHRGTDSRTLTEAAVGHNRYAQAR
jgi:hypothetical protein